jgi:hypothetical protein
METNKELYKIILDQQERNIKAFEGMEDALHTLNDSNVLHSARDNENYQAIKDLISSNKAVVSLLQWVIVATVSALIVLAGAKEVLQFVGMK